MISTSAQKMKSRAACTAAISREELVRGSCDECGRDPEVVNGRNVVEAHHHLGCEDNNALDVQWLCRRCHRKVPALGTADPVAPSVARKALNMAMAETGKMSHRELAKEAGIGDTRTVSEMEDTVTVKTLLRLAKVFDRELVIEFREKNPGVSWRSVLAAAADRSTASS